MTTKESARLRGFWTHKQTGECIVVNRVTMQGEAYARQVGKDTKPLNKMRLILLVRELKEEYVKGMR
ncbi:hypothetical protein COL30_11875 [Bacillus pseudomycoides]|uniref:hypothetical protein n=1 Tax=Bacillus pseudomycoides TaxID=64104 RepID=UPI000BEBCEC5|nr:hypothetical protein [Bacillus pseudomycoides]PED73029.1 hypothetical protein CON97_05300 [Bacillus pseudomycoides]PFW79982.1 hypothetical protein COL30_11875 [Bacillus pseudomycoides]PFZ49386.1 hypothetical protein COL56_24575 [Bacillus pseudomycoides]PHE48737.1 hypothetical protein COF53_11505 [Bacillus pseudomycoides]